LKVLYRLSSLSHEAYLVGGSVRDLLLGRKPKDFDVGTDARPNEIKRMFRNCFLVGRRFRLAHIVFGKKVIETATFRKAPDANAVQDEHGLYQYEDNTFGTPCEDAHRRDFTVNGLFYDIKTFAVIDYVGGLKDLKHKVIRSIGDPAIRFREDPVRMMRAVRFAAKLGFTIASSDWKAMKRYAGELTNASLSRLAEEILRLFVKGATARSLQLAYEGRLLHALLPSFAKWLDADKAHPAATWRILEALDALSSTVEVTPAVAFTALYWAKIQSRLPPKPKGQNRRVNERYQRRLVAQEVLSSVVKHYRLPRAVWMTAVDIVELTPRFLAPPQKTRRDVRFALYSVFPEALQWGTLMASLEPEKTWHLEAWKAFAIACEREKRGEQVDSSVEAASSAATPELAPRKRRKRRKRRSGAERRSGLVD
jgi:poly(A) polymerase